MKKIAITFGQENYKMPVLDRIKQMQQQGINESQIITQLQEEGVPPREINDALAQSKVKQAVAGENSFQPPSLQQPQQPAQLPQEQVGA